MKTKHESSTDHNQQLKHPKTHLFEQQLTVRTEAGNKVLCKSKEWAQHLCSEMISGRSLKHVTDDKESSVLDHVLLHCLRTLYQFTDKTQQLWTETEQLYSAKQILYVKMIKVYNNRCIYCFTMTHTAASGWCVPHIPRHKAVDRK
jgi:hypothetical protein